MKLIQLVIFANLLVNSVPFIVSPLTPFNEWHCVEFMKNVDVTKPFAFNVGELPLVTWFKNKEPMSTVNICSHMGSKLDHGKVLLNGCLICPYHGLSHSKNMSFGETIIFEDKLWWSYKPKKQMPPKIPLYHNKKYSSSYISVDIDTSLITSVNNLMDINHAAHVHNNMLGFGSNIPVTNVKTVEFEHDIDKYGLSFTYKTNSNLRHIKTEMTNSENFHIYEYPYFAWSRVSMPNNQNLFINVNMLPIAPNKTRWFVTVRHNFWTSYFEKYMVEIAARCILQQDKEQLSRQIEESELKQLIISEKHLKNEEHFADIHNMLLRYKYPDKDMVVDLVKYHKNIHP